MSADQWCLGYRRSAHVPDGGLIATNIAQDRNVRLCDDCHRRWAAEDTVAVDW